ncbi:MAG: 50S ribosomal protein L3 [bacterium]|jgi:large subunit ribosomal protein L3|nr:50S ribosomal protein L3 [bacterium]
MVKAILGRKLRMTQMFTEDGRVIPLTAIEVGPCPITQVKTQETDGYTAIQIGFDQKKEVRTPKPMKGHFAKANVAPLRVLKEIRVADAAEFAVGQELNASLFEEGDHVDVSSKSKGRGFQGGIRRHGWGGGRKTHGSMFHRAIGSLGPGTGIGRIFKGKTLPGHMGHENVTIRNLKVVKVDAENGLIFVHGGIPGPSGAVVYVKQTTKNYKK